MPDLGQSGAAATIRQYAVVGAVWRSRRRGESWRLVTITEVDHDWGKVFVRRNTSRRTQAISFKTLLKDYQYATGAEDA